MIVGSKRTPIPGLPHTVRGSDISKYGGTLIHGVCFLNGDGIFARSGTVTIAKGGVPPPGRDLVVSFHRE